MKTLLLPTCVLSNKSILVFVNTISYWSPKVISFCSYSHVTSDLIALTCFTIEPSE